MITREAAKSYLREWSSSENHSINVGYPSVSAGFDQYRHDKYPDSPPPGIDDEITQRTGWVIGNLRDIDKITLRQHYRDGLPKSLRKLNIALDRFRRKWGELTISDQ